MKIKAILPYFGGKRKLASRIVDVLGDHRVYWEPFCGSMAVLMAKPTVEMETVNDLFDDLINLARVLADRGLAFELYDRVSRTLYCESLWRDARERWGTAGAVIDNMPDIERAYDYFVVSWMGINGVSGTERCNYQFALRWCRGGGQGARRWNSVVQSIPAWHKRLANVVIVNRDGFEIIENIKDDSVTAVYIDPPYLDKSDKYLHDFSDDEHKKLAELLRCFEKAKVVISYYDDDRLADLYGPADWRKIRFGKSYASLRNATRGPKKRPRKEQVEILLVNRNVKEGLF